MREIKFRAWNGGEMIRMEGISWSMFWDEVDQDHTDSVLMQFTGLKDKNGKEIYEGDVYFAPEYRNMKVPRVVEWGKEVNCGGCCDSIWVAGFIMDEYREAHKLEVIGNIYENPELIK